MMSLQLPRSHKSWKSLNDREIFPMTWAAVDADRVFIRFMELCMRNGRTTLQMKKRSPLDLEFFVNYLSECGDITGLDADKRSEVIMGWVESSLAVWQGKSKQRELANRQMAYFRPVTLGVIRACLQADGNDIRYADLVAYRMCLEELHTRGVTTHDSSMRNIVHSTLGHGIKMSDGIGAAGDEPKYDETEQIDISALLAMRLLRLFTDARPEDPVSTTTTQETWPNLTWLPAQRRRPASPTGLNGHALIDRRESISCLVLSPEAFAPLGSDLINTLQGYSGKISHREMTAMSIALTSLRLFQAPLIVSDALATLIREDPNLSEHGFEDNRGSEAKNLEIYCDFTNGADLNSLELAKKCVQRDIEKHRRLLADRLQVRVLSELSKVLDQDDVNELATAKNKSHRDYVELLLVFYRRNKFSLAGNFLYQQFKSSVSATNAAAENLDKELNQVWSEKLDEIDLSLGGGVEKFLKILKLAKSPGSEAQDKQMAWFRTSGGLSSVPPHKSYALLSGTAKAKQTWHYSPSDSLIKALLWACFLDETGIHAEDLVRLSELLRRLENRFGILVGRPPMALNNPDNAKAAVNNQQIFIRKLRLLGCYEGLSDDPTYQYVRRPGS